MMHSEYNYCELVLNGYGGKPRNNVLSISEINRQITGKELVEAYRSHFRFKKDFQDYTKENNSVAGYKGDAYVDYLWVDIDHEDLNKALETAKIYLNRLQLEYDYPVDYLRCFFSGNKGFHIGIPSEAFDLQPGADLPDQCKAIVTNMAGDLGVDLSIFDKTRLFRLSNSKHKKSGKYKVELLPEMLIQCGDISEILAIATTSGNGHRSIDIEEIAGVLSNLVVLTDSQPDQEAQEKPSGSKDRWVTSLLENGLGTGNRTNAVTRLAGFYKSKHIPEDVAFSLIQAWDIAKNTPPLTGDPAWPADKILSTVAGIYKYPGEVEEEKPAIEYHTWQSVHEKAPAYVRKLQDSRVEFGLPKIDRDSSCLGRGEVAILLAYVGVGKTAWAQSVQLKVAENQGIPSILFSLEMTAMRLYFRQLAMMWSISQTTIENDFLHNNQSGYVGNMSHYDNMYVVDYAPMSVPLMTDVIKTAPEPVGLAIVDYVGLLSTEGDRPYDRMTKLSRDLSVMAKELDIALLCIYQTNREGRNGEISLAMARDSGMIEANCDIALGLWIDPADPSQRIIKLLKARHGRAGAEHVLAFTNPSPRLDVVDRGDDDYESSS